MLPKEDRFLMTKPELLNKITGLLGGRVAEDVVFGEASTGAHNDFQRATDIARRMVTEYGMSEKLGPLQFGQPQHQVFLGRDFHNERNYSDNVAFQIDEEIKTIIKECYAEAKKILIAKRDKLDLIANALLKVETLDADQINSLYEKGVLPERNYDPAQEQQEQGKDDDVKVNITSKPEADVPAPTKLEDYVSLDAKQDQPLEETKDDDLDKKV